MARPWRVLDRVATPKGLLELRRRGERDFLITVGGRVLMNSANHRSEAALGQLACGELPPGARPRVLVGGLGMGFTLRAALDALPATAKVVVAELNPAVVRWCEGPLAELTEGAAADPRVETRVADVAGVIRRHAAAVRGRRFDAILLDLYQGPHRGTDKLRDPLYGRSALETARAALNPRGLLAVWGEDHDPRFEKRLTTAGFAVRCERPGRGGYRHVVYLGKVAGSRTKHAARR